MVDEIREGGLLVDEVERLLLPAEVTLLADKVPVEGGLLLVDEVEGLVDEVLVDG